MPAINGIPSVTEILRDVGLARDYARWLPPARLQRTRQRGAALHQAIEWHHQGRVTRANCHRLHPEIQPGFVAYLQFCEDTQHEPWYSELAVVHPWGYAGHLDRVGTYAGHPAILDWKYTETPDLEAARYQLGGYAPLWSHYVAMATAASPTPSTTTPTPSPRRYVIQLGRDGRWRPHEVTDGRAVEVFLAALTVYKARHPNGREETV
jgi:hypothetical protein